MPPCHYAYSPFGASWAHHPVIPSESSTQSSWVSPCHPERREGSENQCIYGNVLTALWILPEWCSICGIECSLEGTQKRKYHSFEAVPVNILLPKLTRTSCRWYGTTVGKYVRQRFSASSAAQPIGLLRLLCAAYHGQQWKDLPQFSCKTVPALGFLKETFHGIPAKVYPVSTDSV